MRKLCLHARKAAIAVCTASSLVVGLVPVTVLAEATGDEATAPMVLPATTEEVASSDLAATEDEGLAESDGAVLSEHEVPDSEAVPQETALDEAAPEEAGPSEDAEQVEEGPAGEPALAPEGEPALTDAEDGDEPEAEVTLDSQAATSGTIDGCTWTLSSDGTLTITAGAANGSRAAGELSSLDSWARSTSNGSKVRKVVFEGGVRPARGYVALFTTLPSNSNFPNITSIDVSGFDTSGVTNFQMMFYDHSKLTQVIGLDKLDTSSASSMYAMFSNCTALKSVSLKGMDTSNVSNMSNLFWQCTSLQEVDFTGIDTSNVTDVSNMFWDCGRLTRIPGFAELDLQNVQRLSSIFQGCTSLASVTMPAGGAYASQLGSMFSGCTGLRTLDISRLDMTTAATQSYGVGTMFYQCDALTSLTLGELTYLKGTGLPKGTWYSGSLQMSEAELEDVPLGGALGTWKRMPFADVPMNHWAREVIWKAVNEGLMTGYTPKSSIDPRLFGTKDKITRGQIAVFLWNWAGRPAAGANAKAFSDVARNAYYYTAVRWASSAGVVSGYESGKFGPNDNITREQLAVMLANYARNVAGIKVTGSASDYAGMSDADQVASYARNAMGWCVKNSILSGANGKLMPKGSATRAQTAKMVVFLRDRLG